MLWSKRAQKQDRPEAVQGQAAPEDPRLPAPPLMQVVTKGWWYRPDEFVSAEKLSRRNREDL